MFNNDFFPTPPDVIDTMLSGMDFTGKVVLEPSAGKGDIVDALKALGAKKVLTYEKNPDLQKIVAEKSVCVGSDFLTSKKEQFGHLNAIIANPPFSNGARHILHMWEIAPEGCEIIALCNSNTLLKFRSRERRELLQLIEDYGNATHLGDCFSKSERKTGVEVSMVKLTKPLIGDESNWDGFFMDDDNEDHSQSGVLPYNEVRNIVGRYVTAVKLFDKYTETNDQMNQLLKPVGLNSGFGCAISYDKKVTTKEDFAKELQKESWKWIFKQMNVGKYVTSGVMKDINKFVEEQQKYPFTMKNIYRMFEIIIGTRSQTMDRAMVEVFDKLTMHHHDNRYQVEGWKTNSHYLVGKKFILDWTTEPGYYGLSIRHNGNAEKMDDLHKALCYLTGEEPTAGHFSYGDKIEEVKKITTLYSWAVNKGLKSGKWYDWGFFEIKGFKKGTLHCKFKDENVWAMFNRKVAEIKGFPLPEKL